MVNLKGHSVQKTVMYTNKGWNLEYINKYNQSKKIYQKLVKLKSSVGNCNTVRKTKICIDIKDVNFLNTIKKLFTKICIPTNFKFLLPFLGCLFHFLK